MEAIPIKWYVICSLFLYYLAGINFYLLDRRWGVKFQNWRYKMTHKVPLPIGQEAGFVYNRSSAVKFVWAGLIATVTGFILVIFMGTNPVVEIFKWFFDTLMTFVGIICGPLAYRIWTGRKATLDRVDKIQQSIQSGQIKEDLREGVQEAAEDLKNLGQRAAEAASEQGAKLVDVVRDKIDDGVEVVTGKRPTERRPAEDNKTKSPGQSPSMPEAPAETPENLREMVDRYTKKT